MATKKFNPFRKRPLPPWDRWSLRTYILPTQFGLYFAGAVVLMLGMALSYANNLVFFVCFFLASFGIVAMHLTNRNVKLLKLDESSVKSFFADARGEIHFMSKSMTLSNLYNIQVRLQTNPTQPFELIEEVLAQSGTSVSIPLTNLKRGWNSLPALQIQSDYPFRMCRSWKKINVDKKVLVYPARVGSNQFPEQGEDYGNNFKQNKQHEEDFEGHKLYVPTDPVRRIDWKASAKHEHTLVKKYDKPNGENLIFHWQQTEHLHDVESRLSQLALWIDLAEKKHMNYQLVLPFWKSSLSKGTQHWSQCLKALALNEDLNVSN